MDDRRKKIQFGNESVDAIEMSFQTGGEHWNEYLLTDGSVFKLKVVVTEILKIDGKYDAEGNPVYLVKSANVVFACAPGASIGQCAKQGHVSEWHTPRRST